MCVVVVVVDVGVVLALLFVKMFIFFPHF